MIEEISNPGRHWLPVFLPGMYKFGYSIQEFTGFDDSVMGESIPYPGKATLAWAPPDTTPTLQAYTHFRFESGSPYYADQVVPVLAVDAPSPGYLAVALDVAFPLAPGSPPIPGINGTLYIGDPEAVAPPVIAKIEVSVNNTDFSGAITAGLALLPADANNEYGLNAHAYLESLFTPGAPVFGTDTSLFKYYRVLVGSIHVWDGTDGTPDVATSPWRVLYASELTALGVGSTSLTIPPTSPNSSQHNSIQTIINAGVVSNSAVLPEGTEPCPAWPIHLYWLNRKGGWQSHVFNGKHEAIEEIPEAEMFTDYLGFEHKAAIKGMRNARNVFSGYIPADRYDMVRTIRSAIRVFQSVEVSPAVFEFREVNIKGGTFPIRKEGNRLYECNLSFTYAEPVIIQTA